MTEKWDGVPLVKESELTEEQTATRDSWTKEKREEWGAARSAALQAARMGSTSKAPGLPIAATSIYRRTTVRDWSEDVDGIPAAEIQRAILFHLDANPNTWYKDNGKLVPGYIRASVKKLVEEVPDDWEPGRTLVTSSGRITLFSEACNHNNHLRPWECPVCTKARGLEGADPKVVGQAFCEDQPHLAPAYKLDRLEKAFRAEKDLDKRNANEEAYIRVRVKLEKQLVELQKTKKTG